MNERAGEPLPRGLFSAAPLGAVFVLLVNDHLLKGAQLLPGWLTGKLSDVAGLFFFPVLLVEVAVKTRALDPSHRGRHRALAVAASILTATFFAATKTLAPLAALASTLLGKVVCDPTDLVALPMCALSAWWMTRASTTRPYAPRESDRVPRRVGETLAMLGAAFASLATSAIHYPPCHEPPKAVVRTPLASECVQSEGAHVTLQGATARVVLVLRAKTPCGLGTESLAIEFDFPGGHGIARAETPGTRTIEQDLTVDVPIALPYPTHCAGIRAYFERPGLGGLIDVPIAGCTEGS